MKIIVDEKPKYPTQCIFFRSKEGKTFCLLDEDSPISDCYGTNSCPYLITLETYLKKFLTK